LNGKKANECSREEIKEETWKQLCKSVNTEGKVILKESMIINTYLDRDIQIERAPKLTLHPITYDQIDINQKLEPDWAGYMNDVQECFTTINQEPLLVNRVNTWVLRPEAFTGIGNLFLASDYVRTNTDLATMEGANEAARRAVNCIITKSNKKVPLCKIWDLHEPMLLSLLRKRDKKNYAKGLPWQKDVPFWVKLCVKLLKWTKKMVKPFKR
jgi:Uncharacterized conserved protein